LKINGILSQQRIIWEINIEFEKKINVTESTWEFQSVGTIFFNLSKL